MARSPTAHGFSNYFTSIWLDDIKCWRSVVRGGRIGCISHDGFLTGIPREKHIPRVVRLKFVLNTEYTQTTTLDWVTNLVPSKSAGIERVGAARMKLESSRGILNTASFPTYYSRTFNHKIDVLLVSRAVYLVFFITCHCCTVIVRYFPAGTYTYCNIV